VLKFLERYASEYALGGKINGIDAQSAFLKTTLFVVPMVNPDGVDLVTGELNSGAYYNRALRFGENYPQIPFPSGWKANIDGIDPNLQYPAGWELAREIKFSQGYTKPGPRDYVGMNPLEAPESRNVYDFTRQNNFALTISYHTQGKVIFWQYMDYKPENSYEIAQMFSQLSGYQVSQTPYESGHAGYKDWFIQDYDRPGYTFEVGIGTNPLPLSQFDEIYERNAPVMAAALTVTA
jgi:g-D-glutamyl-meso-diaminopimelate peptidase